MNGFGINVREQEFLMVNSHHLRISISSCSTCAESSALTPLRPKYVILTRLVMDQPLITLCPKVKCQSKI